MQSIYDAATLAVAILRGVDPLVSQRIRQIVASGLFDLSHILVIGPGDTEQDILKEIPLSPLRDPFDGYRYGTPGFIPHWNWLEAHDGWWELIFTVGNSGFAYVMFVQDAQGVDPDLLKLCRENNSGCP